VEARSECLHPSRDEGEPLFAAARCPAPRPGGDGVEPRTGGTRRCAAQAALGPGRGSRQDSSSGLRPGRAPRHTRRVTFVEDGQAALVTARGSALRRRDWPGARARRSRAGGGPAWAIAPAHPDFMTKEIHEQAEVLRRLPGTARTRRGTSPRGSGRHARPLPSAVARGLRGAERAVPAGRIARRRVTAVAASEFGHLQQFLDKSSLVLAFLPERGDIDVIEAARAAKSRGARGCPGQRRGPPRLWRLADDAIPLGARSGAVRLSTKSFIAKLALPCAGRPRSGRAAGRGSGPRRRRGGRGGAHAGRRPAAQLGVSPTPSRIAITSSPSAAGRATRSPWRRP